MPREKDFDSVAQLPFVEGNLVEQDKVWSVVASNNTTDIDNQHDSIPCVHTPDDATLRLPPMYRKTPRTGPRWKPDYHFNETLKVHVETAMDTETETPEAETEGIKQEEVNTESASTSAKSSGSLFLLFEAMAHEGIAVALSPQPKYTGGSTYEIFYGDRGNTNTLIERRQKTGGGKIHVSLPGRHCSEKHWTWYWIAMDRGKVYAGISSQPTEQCLGFLDDLAKQDQPLDVSTWYVGIGNSSMKRDGEKGMMNQYRNISLSILPSSLQQALSELHVSHFSIVNVGEDEMDEETKNLLKQYEEECRKARARAEKFGVPYKEPPSFLPWSKMRRLQANPTDGFATGFDVTDPAEKAKQEARRKRFGIAEPETAEADMEIDHLPVSQAWDNEKLIRDQRIDPPEVLWKVLSNTAGDEKPAAFLSESVQPTIMPEKIHLFAIDWAAFKQIRTNDLSAYFAAYSPTYVEWLGDLSCNIHFQDKFTAGRALLNLSTEIPSPPTAVEGITDQDLPDLGAMGWRLGKTMLRKLADDRYGRRNTSARVLFREANTMDILRDRPLSKSKSPPGFSRGRVLGPGSEFARDKGKSKRTVSDREKDGAGNKNTESGITGEPALLRGSLKASRTGYTVEEMEIERAQKRAKH